ncbi:MAG: hypothetical protein RIA69_04825 [Cyclobacteriaceae bacterium]
MRLFVSTVFTFILLQPIAAQTKVDSLKNEILQMKMEVQEIQLGLKSGQKRFQSGVLVSALGYSVTIAGGLMLGRENDKLGQGLLVAGGLTGLTGTFLLVDSFNFLSGKKKRKKKPL